ncbi:MAG: DUF4367 domain-containing protein [Ruminiclostridium sp.]|nr:DUF4367 domain-containing protein [Ruminiclostridium sp.]MBR1831918.1 DUF4367 domain-containing protein [Ruminiclostridium sp.]
MNANSLFYELLEEQVKKLDDSIDQSIPFHKFSLSYRLKKRALLKAYLKTLNNSDNFDRSYRKLRFYQRIRIALLAAITALLLTGASIYVTYLIGGMKAKMYSDHSDVFSLDDENAPEFIEDNYRITYNLEGYEHIIVDNDEILYWEMYENETDRISFSFSPKSLYKNARLNTEFSGIEKITINGTEMLYFETENGYQCLVWDHGDYIFEFEFTVPFQMAEKIIESIQKE